MTIKFPLFEVVPALTLTKLNVGISKVLNKDSIERILKSYIEKIMSHEVLKVEEARVMIDWHSHLQQHDKLNFSKYLSNYLEVQPDLIALILEYFKELKQSDTIKFLLSVEGFANRLNEDRKKAFNFYVSKSNPMSLLASDKIDYIQHLNVIEMRDFTSGQKLIASSFLFESDFSEIFETKFDQLLEFIEKCGLDDILTRAKYLDKQLGLLIKRKESEVTAKAFRQELGYIKYLKFVEANFSVDQSATLTFYNQLKKLISKFEEAIQILAGEEMVRGTFWKDNIERLDGVMMRKSNSSKYKIGVAFFVADFVFCDFGPTGNQIFIYDKSIFLKEIERLEFWQHDHLLTKKIIPNKFPHQVHTWQDRTLRLIKKARHYE